MKTRFQSLILLFVLVIVLSVDLSCTPKVTVQPVPDQFTEAEFLKAEQLYESGNYADALDKYLTYYNQYPNAPLASAALMKIATLYTQKQDDENARINYEKLILNFPNSMFENEAKLEILSILLKQEKYAELLNRAKTIPQADLSRIQKIRMMMSVADAFMATGKPVDAAEFLITAYGLATPIEQNTISEKIKDSFVALTENDIQLLLDRLKRPEDINIVMALKELTSFKKDVIGCLLPLTGPYKTIGQRAARGIELAFNEWVTQSRQPFRLVIKDTGSDQDATVLSVQELLDEKVACIIGPIITADVAAKIAQERRVPIITLTQKSDIPEIGDYVFRNFMTPRMQVHALLSYAMENRGAKRFAMLYPKEKYGTTFMNLFWDEVIEKGGEVVGVETYDIEEIDFTDPVKKLVGLYYPIPKDTKVNIVKRFNKDKVNEKNIEYIFNRRLLRDLAYLDWTNHVETAFSDILGSKKDNEEQFDSIVDFDAIFIPDSPEKIAMIVPQLPYYDVNNMILLGPNIWHSKNLIDMARYYVQGAVLTEGFFEESKSLKVQSFIAQFENVYNEKPGFIEAIAYDTALLIFSTLSKEDFQLRSDIQKALINLEPFDGVTGLTQFDPTGEAIKKLYLLEVSGRQFVELDQ